MRRIDPRPFQRLLRGTRDPRIQVGLIFLAIAADLFQLVESARAWLAGNQLLVTKATTIGAGVIGVGALWHLRRVIQSLGTRSAEVLESLAGSRRRRRTFVITGIVGALVAALWIVGRQADQRRDQVVVGIAVSPQADSLFRTTLESLANDLLMHIARKGRHMEVVRLRPSPEQMLDEKSLRRLAVVARTDLVIRLDIRAHSDGICFVEDMVLHPRMARLTASVQVQGAEPVVLLGLSKLHQMTSCWTREEWRAASVSHDVDSLFTLGAHCLLVPLLIGRGNRPEALGLARDATPSPDSPDTGLVELHRRALCFALMAADSIPGLLAVTERWVSQFPRSLLANGHRLIACQVTRNKECEYEVLGSMIGLDPTNRSWRSRHASLALEWGDLAAAEADGMALIHESNETLRGNLILAEVASRSGQEALAIGLVRDQVKAHPDEWLVHDAMGRLYWRQRRFREAAASWTRTLRCSPPEPEAVLIRRGQARCALGNYELALRDLRSAMRGRRWSGVASYHLGRVYSIVGREAEAERVLTSGMKWPLPESWLYLKRWRTRVRLGLTALAAEDSARVFSSLGWPSSTGLFQVLYVERMEGDTMTVITELDGERVQRSRSILTPEDEEFLILYSSRSELRGH